MSEKEIKSALKFEMDAFEEYYSSEFEMDWLLSDLDEHRGEVELIFKKLIEGGMKAEEIRSLIKEMSDEFYEEVIEGQYWFVEFPFGSPGSKSNLEKKIKTRINYHKKLGWTLDILRDVDEKIKLLKSKKLSTHEYAYRERENRGDIPELDEEIKKQIAKHLRGSKRKKTKRKQNTTVYYFYMKDCPHCNKFNKTWSKLKKTKKNVKFIKYNKDEKARLVKKYGIKTYPAIVRVKNNKHKLYPTDNRSMNKLLKFIGI